MNRLFGFLIAAAALLVTAVPTVNAETDAVALVIGNADYEENRLANSVNDAKAMSALLSGAGIQVVTAIDADAATLRGALANYRSLRAEGRPGFVYFAGHGTEVAGETYILPLDADSSSAASLAATAVSLRELTSGIPSDQRSYIVLDICRTAPQSLPLSLPRQNDRFAAAGDENRTLNQRDLPGATLVALAASSGQSANDGAGEHGLYTQALLQALNDGQASLAGAFAAAGAKVQAATQESQTPVLLVSQGYDLAPTATQEHALLASAALASPVLASIEMAQLRAAPGKTRGLQPKKSGAHDLEFWNAIKDSKEAADYEAYLESFPEGSFAPLARLRIRQYSKDATGGDSADEPAFKVDAMEAPYVALTNANVRALPQADSDKVGQLSKGRDVEVTGRVVGANWYRVRIDGGTGYVFGDLIRSAISADTAPSSVPAPAAATAPSVAAPTVQAVPQPTKKAAAPVPAPKAPAAPKVETKVGVTAKKQEPAPKPAAVAALPKASGSRDCEFCPELVEITPGSFTLGSNNGNDNERPATKVTIRKPFAIGRQEVTVGEWAFCVEDGGCSFKPKKKAGQSDRAPMRNLSWLDAMEYVKWLSKKTGRTYRLPSEAEWEYAARGGTSTAYWWGKTIGKGKTDCKDCGSDWVRKQPPDAGSFAPNPFGLFDTSGSVWEWTADCWTKSHDGAPRDGSARDNPDCRQRVLRGGSWRNEPDYLRSASRFNYDANVRYLVNGFRVAADPE